MRGIDHALQEGFSPLKVWDVCSMMCFTIVLVSSDKKTRIAGFLVSLLARVN